MVAVRRFHGALRKVRAPEGRLPGNAWAPRGDGKGHRKQTALYPRVRVKRWGKSPPRAWQQAWHGNPQSEQGQISSETRPGSPELRVGRVRWLATAIPERRPSARLGGQTELGLWPYRPPLDDLTVETVPRTVGASRGPAGIPHDHPGMGEAHRVARRHAKAGLEAATRRK